MARIIKFSGYAINPGGRWDTCSFRQYLYSSECFRLRHLHVQEEKFDFEKDKSLHDDNCDLAECEKYFKPEPSQMRRQVAVGAIYRHFKGNLVRVIAISQNTENPGAYSVVYECLDDGNNGKIWHRPYDMFVSEVDHAKYPEATQKYRFEIVR